MTKPVPNSITRAVDRLFEINQELKLLEAEKGQLVETVKPFMRKHKLTTVTGFKAQALLISKKLKSIDIHAYWKALGKDIKKLLNTVEPRMNPNPEQDKEGVRSHLGEEQINKICKETEDQALQIKKIDVTKSIQPTVTLPKKLSA